MKNEINTKAKLAFAAFLLFSAVAGTGWYLFSVSQYATYQILTETPSPVSLPMLQSNSTALMWGRSKASGCFIRTQWASC